MKDRSTHIDIDPTRTCRELVEACKSETYRDSALARLTNLYLYLAKKVKAADVLKFSRTVWTITEVDSDQTHTIVHDALARFLISQRRYPEAIAVIDEMRDGLNDNDGNVGDNIFKIALYELALSAMAQPSLPPNLAQLYWSTVPKFQALGGVFSDHIRAVVPQPKCVVVCNRAGISDSRELYTAARAMEQKVRDFYGPADGELKQAVWEPAKQIASMASELGLAKSIQLAFLLYQIEPAYAQRFFLTFQKAFNEELGINTNDFSIEKLARMVDLVFPPQKHKPRDKTAARLMAEQLGKFVYHLFRVMATTDSGKTIEYTTIVSRYECIKAYLEIGQEQDGRYYYQILAPFLLHQLDPETVMNLRVAVFDRFSNLVRANLDRRRPYPMATFLKTINIDLNTDHLSIFNWQEYIRTTIAEHK